MTYKGHIRNRTVVLDDPIDLPEGAAVTIELHAPVQSPENLAPKQDAWKAAESAAALLAENAPDLLKQDIIPPTPLAVENLHSVFASLRTQHLDPPSRIVPDGDGGLVLEWINAPLRQIDKAIAISAEGAVDQTDFQNNRVHSRSKIA